MAELVGDLLRTAPSFLLGARHPQQVLARSDRKRPLPKQIGGRRQGPATKSHHFRMPGEGKEENENQKPGADEELNETEH